MLCCQAKYPKPFNLCTTSALHSGKEYRVLLPYLPCAVPSLSLSLRTVWACEANRNVKTMNH